MRPISDLPGCILKISAGQNQDKTKSKPSKKTLVKPRLNQDKSIFRIRLTKPRQDKSLKSWSCLGLSTSKKSAHVVPFKDPTWVYGFGSMECPKLETRVIDFKITNRWSEIHH